MVSLMMVAQNYEEHVKNARIKCSSLNYEASLPSYTVAIDQLSQLIQKAPNLDLRNKYVKERNELLEESRIIEEGILPAIDQLVQKFDDTLDEELRDSPPADPLNASPVRPNSLAAPSHRNLPIKRVSTVTPTGRPTLPSNIRNGERNNGRDNVRANRARTHTNTFSKVLNSTSDGPTSLPLLDISQSNNAQSESLVKSRISTQASDPGSSSSTIDRPFELAGFDKELISLIQTTILEHSPSIRFQDVAGLDDAKALLQEAIVWPMQRPELFKGIRRPWKGICMFGPPGTGKTFLAKAVANECNTTFFNVSSAILTSKFRGDSEKLIRLLFEIARYRAPSTIFIDEIDSICSKRGNESEHESSRRTKSEFLIQMDGLSSNTDDKMVVVLAATNFPWDLDDALRRRLEKRIYIPLPDHSTRISLLNSLLREVKLSEDVSLENISECLEGYSGSDINNICRDAAMGPMREAYLNSNNSPQFSPNDPFDGNPDLTIRKSHFDAAIQKIMPSVSKEITDRYSTWMKEFGSH